MSEEHLPRVPFGVYQMGYTTGKPDQYGKPDGQEGLEKIKKTVGATNGFKIANEEGYYFFLCLIILSFFFLLCVAILCFFLFLPQGTAELLIFPRKQGRFVITASIIIGLNAEGQ